MIGTKKGKAAEDDGITVTMVEAFEKFGLQKLTEIANSIYDTGEITRQCANSSLKCQNHQEPLSENKRNHSHHEPSNKNSFMSNLESGKGKDEKRFQ